MGLMTHDTPIKLEVERTVIDEFRFDVDSIGFFSDLQALINRPVRLPDGRIVETPVVVRHVGTRAELWGDEDPADNFDDTRDNLLIGGHCPQHAG